MLITDTIYTVNMNPEQRAWFYAEYGLARKDEAVGLLLALFLGCFGLHHFYLRRNGVGLLYLLFFWTGITAILGLIECFFMPGRVRRYNAFHAANIASYILNTPADLGTASIICTGCGMPIASNAVFCPHCGHHVTSHVTA